MRRRVTWSLGAAAVFGTAILVLGPRVGAEGEWGCSLERRSYNIVELAPGGGYATQREALEAGADLISEDRAGDGDRLLLALRQRTGPDRFEPETGKLYLDDRLQAQMSLVRLSDGTWTTGNAEYCSRPPDNATPAVTPS